MLPADRKGAARAIEDFLRALGRDPESEPHLRGTGERVASAFLDELCDGYAVDVPALLHEHGIAAEGGGAGDVVVVRDLSVATTCPHHLMPATGTATVAFAPGARLVGLGVLAKLVDAYAHRLTLQEEIGARVATALHEHLGARWGGCRLLLSHACFTARGERQHEARVETVAVRGAADDATLRFACQLLAGAATSGPSKGAP